jgi:hypothetical protein
VFLLNDFKLQPGVVGDLICEECDEKGLEYGVGKGLVVCALGDLVSILSMFGEHGVVNVGSCDVQFAIALWVDLDLA